MRDQVTPTPKTKAEIMDMIEIQSFTVCNRKDYSAVYRHGADFAISLIANMIIEKLRSDFETTDKTAANYFADWLESELRKDGIL